MGIDSGPAPRQEYPGPWTVDADPFDREAFAQALAERNRKIAEWDAAEDARIQAHIDKMKK